MSYFSTSYLYGLDDLNGNSLPSDFLLRSHDENYKSIMNSIQNTNRFGKILNAYSDPYSNGNLLWSREPYLPRILPYYRVNYLPQYNPYSLQSYYQNKPYQSEVLLPVLVPTYSQNNQNYFSNQKNYLPANSDKLYNRYQSRYFTNEMENVERVRRREQYGNNVRHRNTYHFNNNWRY